MSGYQPPVQEDLDPMDPASYSDIPRYIVDVEPDSNVSIVQLIIFSEEHGNLD